MTGIALTIIIVIEMVLIYFARRKAIRQGKVWKPWRYALPLIVFGVVFVAITLVRH